MDLKKDDKRYVPVSPFYFSQFSKSVDMLELLGDPRWQGTVLDDRRRKGKPLRKKKNAELSVHVTKR